MFTQAGTVIVVCGQTTSMGRPFGQPDAPEQEMPNKFWHEDCSAAAENILLATHALGLGAVWTAGYPAENPEPKDKWKPENIHWERW